MSRLLRFAEVVELTGIGRSQLYRKIRRCEFPAPVEVGQKSVRFRDCDVQDWIDNLPTRSGLQKDAQTEPLES